MLSSSSPPETDDFSLLLHQIVLRSSSSPSVLDPPLQPNSGLSSGSGPQVMYQADSSPRLYFPNVPSLFGISDTDLDGCDSQSEEAPSRAAPSRHPAKRSRAAEVHNLSEKRRRSRINEKLKSLQKLIPNSNKTDKASMLDEAIEYLKQLQLQVQRLTMRNGLSLDPIHLPSLSNPAQLPQMNMGFFEGTGPLNIDLTEAATKSPNHISRLAHIPGPNMSSLVQCGGSSDQIPIIPTQLHISSMAIQLVDWESYSLFCLSGDIQVAGIFREDMLPHQRQGVDHCLTNVLGSEIVDKSSKMPICCEAQSFHSEINSFEECSRIYRKNNQQ